MLVALIGQLAAPVAKVLITCPGRGYRNRFSRLMQAMGFKASVTPVAFSERDVPPYKGRLLSYRSGGYPVKSSS